MENEKQQSSLWKDVFDPGWREREAAHAAKFLAVVPVKSETQEQTALRLAERVKLFETPTLAERIDAAIAHAEAHDEMRHMLWPHQSFALSIGEVLRAAKRGV